MIRQLLNLVITKYCDLSQINYLGFGIQLQKIIDLLATYKSRYFAQPRPIIIKYYTPNGWSLSVSSTIAFPYYKR